MSHDDVMVDTVCLPAFELREKNCLCVSLDIQYYSKKEICVKNLCTLIRKQESGEDDDTEDDNDPMLS